MSLSLLQDINPGRANRDPEVIAEQLRSAFFDTFGEGQEESHDEIVGAFAPGRVNLIGDHTDYNDGFVLPATIDRGVFVVFRRRHDQEVHLRSLNLEKEVAYSRINPSFSALPEWARYVAGVAHKLQSEDLDGGFEGIIYGNVPLGSGLSSSAALEVAVALGLETLFDLSLSPVASARLCQQVEHTYVGVECGIMDQMSSRLGRADHALFLDCRHLDYEHVPLPLDEAILVIADTRVSRELSSSKYNERRAECDESVAYFREYDESISALRDLDLDSFERLGQELPPPLYTRCRHVVTENRRVVESAEFLKQNDLEAFGRLMNASHQSLQEDYEVSSPELDLLVETAQETNGVFGARMTGAGFGGCAVCLAHESALPSLEKHLKSRYSSQFNRVPDLYVVSEHLEATSYALNASDPP